MSQHIRYALIALILILLLAACGGLGGEPRIVATFPPPTPFPADFSYRANIANGAQIYAANCTRCHGIGGAGDGELALSGEVANVPDFTNQAARADESPLDWFHIITTGRIENLMPPWGDALTEDQRWDVAFYTYTLSYTPEQLASGAELFTSAQASLTSVTSNVAYNAGFVQLSDTELASQLNAATLTNEQQLALAAYIRTQPLSGQEAIGQAVAQIPTTSAPIATEEVATQEVAATAGANVTPIVANSGIPGTITGRVTNGTALGTVPPETIVTLHTISPDFTTETSATAPIAADGTFTFTNVQFLDGGNYFVSVPYRDRLFASPSVQADATLNSLDMPVRIYELTEDTSVISIAGMVTQISESAAGDGLEFLQVIRFRNNSDRLFTTTLDVGDSSFASVVVPLPPGSVVLGFQGQERYVVLQEQSTIVDTLPVLPGEDHLVQLLYFVPYTSGAIIEQQVNYALNGPIRVLIAGSNLGVTSEQLSALGAQTVGERQFNGFGADLTLQAGEVVGYTLNGQIGAQSAGVVSANNLLPLLMIIAGSVLLLFIIVMALRQRYARRPASASATASAAASPDSSKLIDALVRQIAELDDQHDKGQINHDVYHQRRTKLKARLAELMDES